MPSFSFRSDPKCFHASFIQETHLHDGTARPHFGHDAAGAPHVDGRAVVALAEQQLGRPVPERHDAVRVPVRLVVLVAEGARQSKVGQLQDARLGDQHVGRLHVAVQDLLEKPEKKFNCK